MPGVLGPGQKAIVMPSYAHMMAGDVEVWSKYLLSPLVPIKEVWYDVHVGKAVWPAVAGDELGARIAAAVTRKRIDVVAAVGGGYWVIEVKPVASMVALGQVLTYLRLFVAEYSVRGEVVPMIVCDEVDDDLLDEFDEMGVGVIVND